MQIVRSVGCGAEIYASQARHRQVRPPSTCPRCSAPQRPEALGYYPRFLSMLSAGRVLRIAIRRFRCRQCGGTLSVLPSFAQPYRLVQSETIDRFLQGERDSADCMSWSELLARYRRRFGAWVSELDSIVGEVLPAKPSLDDVSGWWIVLRAAFGRLTMATPRMLRGYQITHFGRYRCHQAGLPRVDSS